MDTSGPIATKPTPRPDGQNVTLTRRVLYDAHKQISAVTKGVKKAAL